MWVLYCNGGTHLIVSFVTQNMYSSISHSVISALHCYYELYKCTLYVLRRYILRPMRDPIAGVTCIMRHNVCRINGAQNRVAVSGYALNPLRQTGHFNTVISNLNSSLVPPPPWFSSLHTDRFSSIGYLLSLPYSLLDKVGFSLLDYLIK
jgi:hypothetical protein